MENNYDAVYEMEVALEAYITLSQLATNQATALIQRICTHR